MAKDQNRQNNALAVDTDGNIADLKVDPATGRLLLAITAVSEPSSPVLNTSKIDQNHQNVALAVDDSDNIIPLHSDNRNGLLFVDVLME